MTHWFGLTAAQRVAEVEAAGLPAFRAGQISRHVFERHELDPADYTDLPLAMRELVAKRWFAPPLTLASELTADKGRTVKRAWRLHDGAVIESVLMRYLRRDTLCISSQAGCGMGCPFCATGQGGLQRNLTDVEILAQLADAEAALVSGSLPGKPGRVGNVVFMGMGEPLANYNAVMTAIGQIIEPVPNGWGISARGVTISTVGLVPAMVRLSAEGLPVTLALSLHAPDDELRDELVPVNKRFKVAEVLDAAWNYARVTKRRVSIEYALIRDVNDQAARADTLARELRKRGDWAWVHVNVIPLNPTPGSRWTASTAQSLTDFVARLERAHVPVTVRDTRGRDIDGACGQLAATVPPDELGT
ncbi:MAG: 23S rRNA (adenine(2503)-C(2))-methyltransferase RlmN [Propionibacteriaceae bacterium]|nr:23S rRNA (adenine(2503)-C(2))-methyltransferase RlmN [Propionibacteriaceae bacterium]